MSQPSVSYWLAWSGSLLIILLTMSGMLSKEDKGTPWYYTIMRPIYLPHFIFAGYMALTSVFHYFSLLGYVYLEKIYNSTSLESLQLTAEAQQYYLLGHLALIQALMLTNKKIKPIFSFFVKDRSVFLLYFAAIAAFIKILTDIIPGLQQVSVRLDTLGLVSSVVAFTTAVLENKNKGLIFLGLGLFTLQLVDAFLSGWKEQILVPIIMLGAMLYPRYKKTVLILGIPGIVFLVVFLPSYIEVFRKLAWSNQYDSYTAAKIALEGVRSNTEGALETNWQFLTVRVSEIGMFKKYMASTPRKVPYYSTKIMDQGIVNLFPRIFFPNKPIIEEMVMERALAANVIEWYSKGKVSAKPPIIVDGYLSFGAIGVWLFCFLFGLASGWAANTAERLFGGYLFGVCVMYTGLFRVFWRGNSFEFVINNIFWSFIILYFIFFVLRILNILKRV